MLVLPDYSGRLGPDQPIGRSEMKVLEMRVEDEGCLVSHHT